MTSVRKLCAEFNVLFKLNTVVNSFNVDEDMTSPVTALAPVRWKVFQCLAIEAENKGTGPYIFVLSDQKKLGLDQTSKTVL